MSDNLRQASLCKMCIYAKVFAKRSYFALNTFSSLLYQISTALVFMLRFMQKGLGIEYIFVTFRSKIYLYLYIIMHVPKYQVIDNRYIYIRVCIKSFPKSTLSITETKYLSLINCVPLMPSSLGLRHWTK